MEQRTTAVSLLHDNTDNAYIILFYRYRRVLVGEMKEIFTDEQK